MTPGDSMELVEIVAHAVCPFTDALDGACMRCKLDERGPNGGVRGCMHVNAAAARAIITAIEASGRRIVPVEPKSRARELWEDAARDALSASPKVTT